MTANAGTASNDKTQQLELVKQLADLQKQGIITLDEFNQKKADILSKL